MKTWLIAIILFWIIFFIGLFGGFLQIQTAYSITFGVILLFTISKTTRRAKLAVVGALWGIFSFLSIWGIGHERYTTLIENIFFLPASLSNLIYEINPNLFDILPFIGPVVFGPLILVGVNDFIEKYVRVIPDDPPDEDCYGSYEKDHAECNECAQAEECRESGEDI